MHIRPSLSAAFGDDLQPECWDCAMTDNALGGYRITALGDTDSLHREGEALGLPLTGYAWRCVEEGLRLFRFEGPGDWILVLSPTDTGWEVDEILGARGRKATTVIEDVAEAWSLLYAGVLPPSRVHPQAHEEINNDLESDPDDGPEEDDTDEDEDGRPRCPFCHSADDCDHHIATIEIDEGISGGLLYGHWSKGGGEWEEAAKGLKLRLAQAVLSARPDPDWDYGMRKLHKALHEDLADIPGLTIAGPPAATTNEDEEYEDDEDSGPLSPDDLVDSDEWRDAWYGADGGAVVRRLLQEWLGNQRDVHERSYEIAHSPGLTWTGTSYFASDAKDVARRFGEAFLGHPAHKEAP